MLKRLARAASLLSLVLIVASVASAARAQGAHRDHLTPQEVELVRDAQALDARTAVFIKAADRRMQIILGGPAEPQKPAKKEKSDSADRDVAAGDWGDAPKGTRAELLYDVAHILDEAIENIDDTAMHNPKSPLLHKSVRKLSDAAARVLAQLLPLRSSIRDDSEREQLELAIDNAQQIIDAAKKLPAEEPDAKHGKKG